MINPVYPTIISNAVTAGNLLADTTTANAFIAPVGIDFSRYRGDFIEIYSGTTLWAQAWISESAPGGESLTLRTENSNFTTDTGWWAKGTGVDINVTTPQKCHFQSVADYTGITGGGIISVNGGLYKYMASISSLSTGGIRCRLGQLYLSSNTTSFTKYFSAGDDNTAGFVASVTGTTLDLDDAYIYRVDVPASTGALLLSTKGGSRGWAYKHASFNPNAAVTLRILARRIASGAGGYYK